MSQPLPGPYREPEEDRSEERPPAPWSPPQYPPPPYDPGRHYGHQADPAYGAQYPLPAVPRPSRRRQTGLMGTLAALMVAVVGYGKYLLIAAKAVPLLVPVLSILVSFAAYSIFAGPTVAAALIAMIFVHEMGHVIEIRRQGLKATAPIFIPFFGAAIFQRSHPQNALRQAEIGIAGPVAGTIGATAAYILYGMTGQDIFAVAAWIGFLINLINLVPSGMLDGGWITAPISKWFQVVGLVLMGLLVLTGFVSPILLIIVVWSIPVIISRFRNADSPYFTSVPVQARWAMAAAWLGLTIYLSLALVLSEHQLLPVLAGR
jgi:Zn-dependent protease